MRIFDCTTFFNENLMLEVRFNILNKYVDKFIVAEAKYSHSGEKKKLNFDIKKFPEFKKKIIYIVIDNEPENVIYQEKDNNKFEKKEDMRMNSIKRIAYQRNKIINYLDEADEEDFIFYNHIDKESIKRYVDFLQNTDFSFVRLVRCGFKEVDTGLKHIMADIYDANTHDPDSFSFQMQATIWKKSDMIKLYNEAKSPLWLEPAAPWRECIRKLGIKGSYCYNGEEQKGKYHWDTKVFPHIVSAIQKGKWNTLQYDGKILDILKEYNIDPNIRGIRRVF